MRHSILIVFSLLVLSATGQAQEAQPPRGRGYVFFAPGTVSNRSERATTLHIGGGYERLVYKGLGVGSEIGIQKEGGDTYALFSANGSYHFTNLAPNRKIVPFLTAGYSGAFNGEGGENWFNFGGGLDYWLRPTKALRLEVRDHVDPQHERAVHYLEYRIGLVW